ncbi:MAG: DUF3501 family protein [Dehalococcoidia bacterium]
MQKIKCSDVCNIIEYEKRRGESHAHIIALKRSRRVTLGPKLSFLFENRDTVLHQVQEMMRAERIVDEDKVQDEIDVYNQLIPDENQLSATMFIEIQDQVRIKEELDRFQGVDRPGRVYMLVDGQRIECIFEAGRSKEDKISAVQYVRFPFSPEQVEAFRAGREARLGVDHPGYRQEVILPEETRKSLAEDFS